MGFLAWLSKALTPPPPTPREELAPGADGPLGPNEIQKLFANNTVSMSIACDVTLYPDGRAEWQLFEPGPRIHGGDGTYDINRFDGTVTARLNTQYGRQDETITLSRRDGTLIANDRTQVSLRPV